MTRRSRLAVTLGDPAGIGSEVILKALADRSLFDLAEVTVIGSRTALQDIYAGLKHLDVPLANPDELLILDMPAEGSIEMGRWNAASGAASFSYLEKAIALTLADRFDGIVTGPIAKSAWKAAGHHYPGQTELLAERAGAERFGMLFVARSPHTGWMLRTLLATTHIPLRQVPDALTPSLLTQKLDLLIECLQADFGIKSPRIAVAGLNPHSGEGGQLGFEERDWMIDWIEQAKRDRPWLQLDGPVPPDTLWVTPGRNWYRTTPIFQSADAYLALYHDQGLIPVKMMAFDRAVNTTIGLPFVRTSPDHGTAFDIAGKGVADDTSFKASLQLAAELSCCKTVNI